MCRCKYLFIGANNGGKRHNAYYIYIYVGGLSVAFSCADASAYGFWLGSLLGFFFLIGGGEVYCLECSAMVVKVGTVGRVILSAESVAEVRARYDAEFVVSSVRW